MNKLLLLLLITPLLFSCGDSKDDNPTNKDGLIAFKFNANTAPTGANNLIGVQIYKGNVPYAYGLFDNVNNIKIDLQENGKFTIKSSIVIDGKTKLSKDANGYLKPFALNNGKGVDMSNRFVISSNEYLEYLSGSTATLGSGTTKSSGDNKEYKMPPLDRWYGESAEYNGDSNENPTVNMQRYVFGIRFTVEFIGERVQPDDCLFLAVKGAPDTLFVYAKDAVKTIEAMYTYPGLEGKAPNSISLDVYHKLTNGELRRMDGTSGETLYRNDLMILKHQVIRDSKGMDSYPYKWGGIGGYYGDRGE